MSSSRGCDDQRVLLREAGREPCAGEADQLLHVLPRVAGVVRDGDDLKAKQKNVRKN